MRILQHLSYLLCVLPPLNVGIFLRRIYASPLTNSALSPTYASLPSLFDDDQLTAFFCAGKTVLPDETSSTLSDLESNGSGTTNK